MICRSRIWCYLSPTIRFVTQLSRRRSKPATRQERSLASSPKAHILRFKPSSPSREEVDRDGQGDAFARRLGGRCGQGLGAL